MATNKEVFDNFCEDDYRDLKSDKESNNLRIIEKEDFTVLEGYGHAMYGLKIGNTVVIFNGWRGYSNTTSKHLTIFERRARKTMGVTVHKSEKDPKSRQSNLENIFDREELEEVVPKEKLSEMTAQAL